MKQPRVPEYRDGDGLDKYLRALVLFLKDFCQETWMASRLQMRSIDAIHYPVTSVNGKDGDVQLGAADVGARADTWTPTAQETGALPAQARATDSAKLMGKTWAQLVDALYPVGSVYISAEATSPASVYGGTWEQLKDRFLLGAGERCTAGDTGGVSAVTLTYDQMPSHSHGPGPHAQRNWVPNANSGRVRVALSNSGTSWVLALEDSNDYVWGQSYPAGSSSAHENMPPYLAVYMWKRVA